MVVHSTALRSGVGPHVGDRCTALWWSQGSERSPCKRCARHCIGMDCKLVSASPQTKDVMLAKPNQRLQH